MLCGFVFGHNIIYVKDNKTSTRHCQPSLVPRPPTLLLPDPPPSCSPTSRPTFHSLHSYWLWGGEVGGGGEAVTTLSRIVVFFQQGCILFVCLLLLTCNILDSSLHCLQTILFSRNTALHFAAWRNWSEIVELLLVNGAKVSYCMNSSGPHGAWLSFGGQELGCAFGAKFRQGSTTSSGKDKIAGSLKVNSCLLIVCLPSGRRTTFGNPP